jgi:hypothetical protein
LLSKNLLIIIVEWLTEEKVKTKKVQGSKFKVEKFGVYRKIGNLEVKI